eukprot:4973623-Pyramimonas_sp.AAC.1
MELKQWRQAAELYCGGGLEDGVDMYSYRKFVDDLTHAKRGRQLSELMVSIATGGFWAKARSFDADLCSSDVCERCKDGRES